MIVKKGSQPMNRQNKFSLPAKLHSQTYKVLNDFGPYSGTYPFGTLTLDKAGDLYGTTYVQGPIGVVFQLTPSENGWTQSVLYRFNSSNPGSGSCPNGGLIFDSAGRPYGTRRILGKTFGTTPSRALTR